VVTSVNAVHAIAARLDALGPARDRLRRVRTAAVGPATAAALARLGSASPLLAAEHSAAALAEAIPDVAGRRVLFPCGDVARDELPAILRQRGAEVDAFVAYRTVPAPDRSALVREVALDRADAIVVASPSAVQSTLSALMQSGVRVTDRPGRPAWFCIGPVTADALRAHGIDADVIGAGALEGFVERIETWYLRHVAV
jgi:uroporphyrinogen-III synthase